MKSRQKCGRCSHSLTLGKFAPASRGKPGKWCRSCRSAHAKAKRAEKSKEEKAS